MSLQWLVVIVIYLHTTFVFVCFWITWCDETDVKEVFFSVENTWRHADWPRLNSLGLTGLSISSLAQMKLPTTWLSNYMTGSENISDAFYISCSYSKPVTYVQLHICLCLFVGVFMSIFRVTSSLQIMSTRSWICWGFGQQRQKTLRLLWESAILWRVQDPPNLSSVWSGKDLFTSFWINSTWFQIQQEKMSEPSEPYISDLLLLFFLGWLKSLAKHQMGSKWKGSWILTFVSMQAKDTRV